ncbi:MAG: amino acid permease [Acidimicrobiales bacterium]
MSPAMAKVVTAAAAISAFGAQLACINAANRLLFALGRELGGGRSATNLLVRTDRRFRSPVGALAVTGVASLAGLMAFSFEHDATRALTLIVTLGSYLILAAYLMTLVAAAVWVWRHGRKVIPLVILGVGIVVFLGIIYYTFHPFPAAPFNAIVFTAAGCVVAGIAFAALPGVRRRLARSELLGAARSS